MAPLHQLAYIQNAKWAPAIITCSSAVTRALCWRHASKQCRSHDISACMRPYQKFHVFFATLSVT